MENSHVLNINKQDVELNDLAINMIPEFESFNPVKHLPESFYVNIVASRRSGKGITSEWILNQFQKSDRKFDNIFLISPTGDTNFLGIPPSYKFDSLDILEYIMKKQREIKAHNSNITRDYERNHVKSRIAIVIDDLAFGGQIHQSNIMDELAFNGRHISNPVGREGNCLSVIVLSQQLSKISPGQRRNNDFIIFNSMSSSLESESVLAECFFVIDSSRRGKAFARKLYQNLTTSKDYRFLAVGNCIQNRRRFTDFIFTSDAVIERPFKLFGETKEWVGDTYFSRQQKTKDKYGNRESNTDKAPAVGLHKRIKLNIKL